MAVFRAVSLSAILQFIFTIINISITPDKSTHLLYQFQNKAPSPYKKDQKDSDGERKREPTLDTLIFKKTNYNPI